MKAKKIEKAEIKDILISSLPSRPTAPKSHGGRGYGAAEMKEAFDKLPLYIVARYNELIEAIGEVGDDSLAAAIPSGIKDEHTLKDLFLDVKSGALATYLTFLGKTLHEHIVYLYSELERMGGILEEKEGIK